MKYKVKYIETKKEIITSKKEKVEYLGLKEAIAIKIISKRKELKMKQKDVAKQIGIAQNGLSQIERFGKGVTIKNLEKLCKVFNCKSSDILPF